MTRALLSIGLCVATLALGLVTSIIASHNHDRANNLARLQRMLQMQRAANDQAEARAAAHVWGRTDEPIDERSPEPAIDAEGWTP